MNLENAKDIFQIRDELANLDNLDKIIDKAIDNVRKKIQSQVVSIYLLTKNGYYKRHKIYGFDKNNQPLTDNWYPEKYKAGESFTGRVINHSNMPAFGEPFFSNNLLSEIYISPESKYNYIDKLGSLRGAIAVPLSGKHITFGVIETINKVSSNNDNSKNINFGQEDILWLTIVGISTAQAILNLRKQHETDLLDHLSRMVLDKNIDNNSLSKIFNYILKKLVDPLTYYCTAILWLKESNVLRFISGATSSEDSQTYIFDDTIDINEQLYPAITYKSNSIIKDVPIAENIKSYYLEPLIKEYDYINYIGVPIGIKDRKIGVLSLYTLFKCEIQAPDISWLDSIASNIAMIDESSHLLLELKKKQQEIQRLTDITISKLRKKSIDYSLEENTHHYKNFLTKISTDLIQSLECSIGEKDRKIISTIRRIKTETSVMKQKLDNSVVKKAIDLNQLIKQELLNIKKTQNVLDISFNEHLDHDIPPLYIAEDKIQEIITNIISNAIKAIRISEKSNGVVIILTEILRSKIHQIQISIQDNGIGIRKEDKEYIFDEGYTTDEEGGTGMGLFFSKNIIESLGGTIFVESTVGKGSTFVVRFPLQRYS